MTEVQGLEESGCFHNLIVLSSATGKSASRSLNLSVLTSKLFFEMNIHNSWFSENQCPFHDSSNLKYFKLCRHTTAPCIPNFGDFEILGLWSEIYFFIPLTLETILGILKNTFRLYKNTSHVGLLRAIPILEGGNSQIMDMAADMVNENRPFLVLAPMFHQCIQNAAFLNK